MEFSLELGTEPRRKDLFERRKEHGTKQSQRKACNEAKAEIITISKYDVRILCF